MKLEEGTTRRVIGQVHHVLSDWSAAERELRASLTETMFANFKVIYNFDQTPAPGQGSSDTKYLLGVGLTF